MARQKKLPNKAYSIIGFFLLCFAGGCLLAGKAFSQEAAQIKQGVVTVTAHADGRANHGTGFIVKVTPDITYVVTASHVVEGANRISIRLFSHPAVDVPAKVYEQEGGDPRGIAILAVLLPQSWTKEISALNTSPAVGVSGGDDVLVVGSPPDIGPWTVVKSYVKLKDGRDTILSGQFNAGFSGSPVVKDGQVVAMLTETTAGEGYAVPGVIVLAYLDGENIQVAGTDEVQEGISARLLLKEYGIDYSEESFMASVKRRDLQVIEMFLKAKPRWCDTRNSRGETALIIAAHDGQPDIVNVLIKAGADVAATDSDGVSALMAAAAGRELTTNNIDAGHVKVAEELVASHVDIHAASKLGTPVEIAAYSGNLGVLKLLLGQIGAKNEEAELALLYAASAGRADALKTLLESGVSPNIRFKDSAGVIACDQIVHPSNAPENPEVHSEYDDMMEVDSSVRGLGPTALMEAARARSPECVELLLHAGAEVTQTIKLYTISVIDYEASVSALSFAVHAGDLKCVNLLLKNKSDPNTPAIYGLTVFQNATLNKETDIADALRVAGGK